MASDHCSEKKHVDRESAEELRAYQEMATEAQLRLFPDPPLDDLRTNEAAAR